MADDALSLEDLQRILTELYTALREPASQRLQSAHVDDLAAEIQTKLSELQSLVISLRDLERRDPLDNDPASIAQRYRYTMMISQVERYCETELKAKTDSLQNDLLPMPDAEALARKIQEILRGDE
jgi:hypothetical protein